MGEAFFRYGLIDLFPAYTNENNPNNIKPKSSDVFRIIVLGDSLTAGANSYPHIIETLMNQDATTKHYEVINLAVQGTGPLLYKSRLANLSKRLNPDLVLVALFLGNDLLNVRNPYLKKSWKGNIYFFLKKNSLLTLFIKHRIINPLRLKCCLPNKKNLYGANDPYRFRTIFKNLSASTLKDLEEKRISPILVNLALTYPAVYKDQMRLATAGFKEVFKDLLETLKDIQQLSQSLGAKMALLVLPNNIQVSQRYHQFYRQFGMVIEPDFVKNNFLQKQLQKFSLRHQIIYIDPLPFLQEEPQQDYFTDDGHLMSLGHVRIAQIVANVLIKQKLITKTKKIAK